MKSNLLATKFHRPALPSRRVMRACLIDRLSEGLAAGRPLTLVSAPAGFGKTTCISEWCNRLDVPVVWLALDPADDDPGHFFPYFLAALQKVDKNLGKEIENVLHSGQLPPPEILTTTLVNDIIQINGKFVLVLDDFHVIQDRAILDVLGRLINNQPSQLHLVLVTREDPLLPLGRLRANSQMTEIRTADLRLTNHEVNEFLNEIMELSLSESDITALENRTEGWIVGLQLAGLSMRGRSDTTSFITTLKGSHRYFLSYLTEEVLNRQPEEVQEFLLQTSILKKLNGDLCNAVTGRNDSHDFLEKLLAANLFLISLDDEQLWYRYHHLFADLLRSQQGRYQKTATSELHQRAGRWYEEAGMISEAIEHNLAAGNSVQAAKLLEKHAMQMVMQGYAKTVEGWMQAIPQERRSQNPKANLAFAWMHLLRGNYANLQPYLEQAEAAIAEATADNARSALPETQALQSEWLALQSNLLNVLGKGSESLEMARRALQSIEQENAYLRSLAFMGLGGAYRLIDDYPNMVDAYQHAIRESRKVQNYLTEMLAVAAIILAAINHGQLHFAFETGNQYLDHHEKDAFYSTPMTGPVHGSMGIIYFQWNQIEKARQHFARAGQLSSLSGHNAGVVFQKTLMARIYLAEGNIGAAVQSMQEAANLVQIGVPSWVKAEVAYQQVRVFLAQQNPFAAEAALKEHGAPIQGLPPLPKQRNYPLELVYCACLRLMLYQARAGHPNADVGRAIELASDILEGALRGRRIAIALAALLLRAQFYAEQGKHEASLDDIGKAVEMAEPEGFLQVFLDEGEAMAPLLQKRLIRCGYPDYIRKILAAFPERAAGVLPGTDDHAMATTEDAVEPLTERELEVLRWMANGLKYEEIAGQLVISVNTVRFYVKAIYSKLSVNNRTRAIELARQRGLL